MTNKLDSCTEITVNGFTAVYQGTSDFNEATEVCNTFDGNPGSSRGIADEVLESRWSYNPTEKTHKGLPYPYCS